MVNPALVGSQERSNAHARLLEGRRRRGENTVRRRVRRGTGETGG